MTELTRKTLAELLKKISEEEKEKTLKFLNQMSDRLEASRKMLAPLKRALDELKKETADVDGISIEIGTPISIKLKTSCSGTIFEVSTSDRKLLAYL